MQAGQEVFHSADATQPCGLVAQAASVTLAGTECHLALVALQLSAVQAGSLHLAQAHGASLRLLRLPYTLLEDV